MADDWVSVSAPISAPADDWVSIGTPAATAPSEHQTSIAHDIGAELSGLGAVAGAAFGEQVLGGQELLGHAFTGLGFTNAGKWLIDDAQHGVKKLRRQEAPYSKEAPKSAFAGEVAGGSVIPTIATGVGGAGALTRAIAAGGISGALEPTSDKGNFGLEKAKQIATGGAIGGVAQGIGNKVAGAVAPKISGAAKALLDRGVRLTPGQMVGGGVERAEEAIGSVPGPGGFVRAARRQGVDDFNRAVLGDVLQPLGEKLPPKVPAGQSGIAYVQGRLRDAYSQLLSGKMFKVDPQFATDIAGLRTAVSKLMPPEVSDLRKLVDDRIIPRLQKTGTMDGDTFKDLDSELTRYASRYSASPIAGEQNLGDVIGDLQEKMRDGMERSNPGFAQKYADVRKSYAMLSQVENAASRRVAGVTAYNPDQSSAGMFMPSDLLASIRSNAASTGRRKAYAAGNALMQPLAQAGQDVLPGRLPDSGTPERLATMALLGGSEWMHYLTPGQAAALALAATPYTGLGMTAARAWLGGAGPTRQAISDALRRASPYAAAPAAQAAQSLGTGQ